MFEHCLIEISGARTDIKWTYKISCVTATAWIRKRRYWISLALIRFKSASAKEERVAIVQCTLLLAFLFDIGVKSMMLTATGQAAVNSGTDAEIFFIVSWFVSINAERLNAEVGHLTHLTFHIYAQAQVPRHYHWIYLPPHGSCLLSFSLKHDRNQPWCATAYWQEFVYDWSLQYH